MRVVLTYLFLEFVAGLDYFLYDGPVSVMLLIDNPGLRVLPVRVKLLDNQRLNLVDLRIDRLLRCLQGLIQGVRVTHDLQDLICQVVTLLTYVLLHVTQTVVFLVGVDFEGDSELLHFLVDFLDVGGGLVTHLLQDLLDPLRKVHGGYLQGFLQLKLNLHEVILKFIDLLVQLLLKSIIVELITVLHLL